MKVRLVFLGLFMALNAAWWLLTSGIWTLGAASAPADLKTFPQLANNILLFLSLQPTWIPAVGFLTSFLMFLAWFFWPGLRPWLSGVDLDDVREWSVSFEWGGGMAFVPAMGGTRISIQGCRLVNLSVTQTRMLDMRIDFPLRDGSRFYITSRSFGAPREEIHDRAFLEKFKRNITHLETPLTLPGAGMAEGSFFLLWPEENPSAPTALAFRMQPPVKLTLFEHRSQQQRSIMGGECYDAKQQRSYRGEIGYPMVTWRTRWQSLRAALRNWLKVAGHKRPLP